jgi:predicted acylesterase/phospholipase RssA
MMNPTKQYLIANANRFLEGTLVVDLKDVLEWRKHLRRAKEPALARKLSCKLAEDFIAGKEMSECDVDTLWKACKTDEAFSHARRVLHRRRTNAKNILCTNTNYAKIRPSEQTVREQLALMTSKDPDLSASMRHDWALDILKPHIASSTTETLGIAGGIWKRRWEFDGRIYSLEQALKYYLEPITRDRSSAMSDSEHDKNGNGVTAGEGYPAINAAFIYDLLGTVSTENDTCKRYRFLASELRTRICNSITPGDYWSHVTLAEAYFGLKDTEAAIKALQKATKFDIDPWELETTARQIARLGHALSIDLSNTRAVVGALVGDGNQSEARVRTILIGKVGFALSGGGFRASLYHLGVLARLAESDVLRHVEALSMVSGGSMVGAAYYLRLRSLLHRTGTPTQADYLELVQELIEDFKRGTDANLRSSLLADLKTCRALINGDDKTYADRMANAIFNTLYSRMVEDGKDPQMASISIKPADEGEQFHPRYHNSRREAKVPALLINATTLNTGHSWQFTTTSMGESPFSIVSGADPMPRLRRSYYKDDDGSPARSVTLSQAVAASASVPGLFAPLTLKYLYKGYEVRLVDGGVYDNQGALALMQEDCNVLIVSDGCGQLALDTAPGRGYIAPMMRAFDIFQERMRQGSYENLRAAKESERLKGLSYVHLKQDLDDAPLDWVCCEDPMRPEDQLPESNFNNPVTRFGVWKQHQQALAAIRTDLDVFSDIEAAALMASGYLAMDADMKRLISEVPALEAQRQARDWFFTPIISKLKTRHDKLQNHLEAGSKQFLRLSSLDNKAKIMAFVIFGVIAVTLAIIVGLNWTMAWNLTITMKEATLALLLFLVSYVLKRRFGSWTAYIVEPTFELKLQTGKFLSAWVIWALARWIVPRCTKQYLELGRLDKLE